MIDTDQCTLPEHPSKKEQVLASLWRIVECGLEPKMAYDREGSPLGTSGYSGLQAARGALADIAKLEGLYGEDDSTQSALARLGEIMSGMVKDGVPQ